MRMFTVYLKRFIRMHGGAVLERFPMQMDDIRGSSPFMVVVAVLGDDSDIKPVFKAGNLPVSFRRGTI